MARAATTCVLALVCGGDCIARVLRVVATLPALSEVASYASCAQHELDLRRGIQVTSCRSDSRHSSFLVLHRTVFHFVHTCLFTLLSAGTSLLLTLTQTRSTLHFRACV